MTVATRRPDDVLTRRPDPVTTFACRVTRLLNEVVAGARPGRQISPLFGVHLRGMLCRARPQPGVVARVRRLVITSHRKDVYEVVAICTRAERVVALGLQLTRAGDRWQVTDVAHPQLRAAGALGRCESSAARRASSATDLHLPVRPAE